MKEKTIEEIQEKYNLELERIISEVKRNKAKLVLLQFPDGLKPYATAVADYLNEKTKAEFLIWLGSCYGACDIPADIEKLNPKIDMVIQFGHNDRTSFSTNKNSKEFS
jgi:2-(3-amino-3-carboxypropyl)histidine synthase